jgi:hypothetical protein
VRHALHGEAHFKSAQLPSEKFSASAPPLDLTSLTLEDLDFLGKLKQQTSSESKGLAFFFCLSSVTLLDADFSWFSTFCSYL